AAAVLASPGSVPPFPAPSAGDRSSRPRADGLGDAPGATGSTATGFASEGRGALGTASTGTVGVGAGRGRPARPSMAGGRRVALAIELPPSVVSEAGAGAARAPAPGASGSGLPAPPPLDATAATAPGCGDASGG